MLSESPRVSATRVAGQAEGAAAKIEAPPSALIYESAGSKAALLTTWIVTLWLVAMTGLYIKTAVQAVRYPINPGNQIELAMVWLVLVAAVGISHLFLRRPIVTLIYYGED